MGGKTDIAVGIERRRHPRREIRRPCKLLHSPTLRYMAATTGDLSPGGAMLEIVHHRTVVVGDHVDVLVDWDQSGIVSKQAMLAARVVRVDSREGTTQRIGVAFDRDQAITLAA